MASTPITTTPITTALIFKMAATVSEKNPEISIEKAMAIAQEFASSGFMDHIDLARSNQPPVKSKKKTPGPKRHKNAYMFFLAQNRGAYTKEIHSAISGADNASTDLAALLLENNVDTVTMHAVILVQTAWRMRKARKMLSTAMRAGRLCADGSAALAKARAAHAEARARWRSAAIEEVKVPVKLVVKLAGLRWKKLSIEKQPSESDQDWNDRVAKKTAFEAMADQDKAEKKAIFDAEQS